MKKTIALSCALLGAGCVNAQMPIFRNQFTTNIPGAYVRGNVTFGDGSTWFTVAGPFTNLTGNAYFGGGTTWFADGILVELPATFWQGFDATNCHIQDLRTWGAIRAGGPLDTNQVVIGYGAGYAGTNAVIVGAQAGHYASNAHTVVFLGRGAGAHATNAEYAVFLGGYAGNFATMGTNATFIGRYSGMYSTNSSFATMVGRSAGVNAWSASNATFVGAYAGQTATNAPMATFIGYGSGSSTGAYVGNSVAIGHNAKVTGTNQFILGTGQFVGINTNSPKAPLQVHGSGISTNWIVDPPLWDDVRISLGNLTSPSVAPGRVTVSSAGAATIQAYGFDAAADEALSFELQLPHGINTNNAWGIHCHVHYTGLTAPSTTSNIVWGLTYMAASPNKMFNTVPLTIYATNGLTSTTNHMLAEFPVITNLVESAIIFGTLFRDADNPADEYPADAIALSFDAHYPRRSMGSSGEYGDF